MSEFKERRQGYKWNDFTAWAKRHCMELMVIAAIVVMVLIPEIVGLLEQLK
jgi:hypothetical protein